MHKKKKEQPVIKKIIKKQEAGAHGGSWKVAYADFVTAMMAFFLLMWLINMTSAEKKAALANYFKFYSLFDKSNAGMFEQGSGSSSNGENKASFVQAEGEKSDGQNFTIANQDRKQELKQEIEKKLAAFKSNIRVTIFDEGVRIEIMDNEGKAVFPLGSSVLNPNGKSIFKGIAENIKSLKSRIIIEGHTDALSYSTDKYTNWELSTDRASAARRELQDDGIDPDRLVLVAGYAATSPLIKDNPNDPRNRRISLMLLVPNDRPMNERREYSNRMPTEKGIVLNPGKNEALLPPAGRITQ